jgi:hypothetical protein
VRREAVVARESDRFEPELASLSFPQNVNMTGLFTIKAIEEKAIGSGNSWYVGMTTQS